MTSLDDLDDTPLPETAIPFDRHVRQYLAMLDDFCDRDSMQFAVETLEGVRLTIQRTGVVTLAQETAVENIHLAALKAEAATEARRDARRDAQGFPSRRYEGWGR